MNVITKARQSAFEDSVYGIVKAGEMYYTENDVMTENKEFIIINGVFVGTVFSLPSSGKVTIESEVQTKN